jgi:8-oxo-dGTP pyrophosphatase MutT (NUDIX family)
VSPRGGPQQIPRPEGARPGGAAPWSRLAGAARRLSIDDVRRAVAAHEPGESSWMGTPESRAAAVLIPVFERPDGPAVILTRRSSSLRNHTGEVAFPGGRQDAGESLVEAALREAHEEIGLAPELVEIVGELDRIATYASRYTITPFVGVVESQPRLDPNPAEIERVFAVGISELLDDEVYREEVWDLPWGERAMAFFELEGDTVWGATARILQQFLLLVTGLHDP